jgi:DNA-binding response OmpR family regulator
MDILVVEDETLVAFALEWALRIAGHQVLGPVDSVGDAIDLCRERRPDFALIDLNLRDGGDGVEVACYLNQHYQTPCLFLSAQVAHARANCRFALGLVRKPYDSARIIEIIDFITGTAHRRTSGQAPASLEIFRQPH